MRHASPARVLVLLLGTLALAHAATETWPLDPAEDYSYDPAAVTVQDGVARLYGDVTGTGADGDLSVSGTTFDLSSDVSGSRTVADGVAWTLLSAASAGDDVLTLSDVGDGLAAGDELLLLDAAGSSSRLATGAWETVRVAEVTGSDVSLAT